MVDTPGELFQVRHETAGSYEVLQTSQCASYQPGMGPAWQCLEKDTSMKHCSQFTAKILIRAYHTAKLASISLWMVGLSNIFSHVVVFIIEKISHRNSHI